MAQEKFIVCLRGKAKQGKSESIITLMKLLLKKPKTKLECYEPQLSGEEFLKQYTDGWDICGAIYYNGKKIGINSAGDVPRDVRRQLKKLAEKNCDIIFCASRSKGDTVKEVKKIAKRYNALIWTSPYTADTPLLKGVDSEQIHQCLNEKKAKHLAEFIG